MADPKVNVKIGADSKEFKSEMGAVKSSAGKLSAGLGKLFGPALTAGAIIGIGKAAVEMGKLAASAEAVERGFKRVANEQILDGLRDAVRGTVTDLELMQQTVSANQLGLSVQNLATLFEFAKQRADETGQSVDHLTNSIVTGIGRKSPLILDNLGISAIALKEALGGVSLEAASVGQVTEAVGKIAKQALDEAGDAGETNADKIARFSATMENMRVELGEKIAPVLGKLADFFTELPSKISPTKSAIIELANSFINLYNSITPVRVVIQTVIEAATFGFKILGTVVASFIDGIKGLFDAFVALKDNGVKGFTNALKESVKEISGNFVSLADKAIESFDNIKGAADNQLGQIVPKEKLEAQGKDMGAILAEGIGEGLSLGIKDIDVGDGLDEMIAEMNDSMDNFVIEPFITKLMSFTDFINNELMPALSDGMATMIEDFASAVGELIATGDVKDFGKQLLASMGSFMKKMGGLLIAYGIAQSAFAKALKNPANPVSAGVLIAAGAALVAIGSAISAAAAAGPSGAGGAGAAGAFGGSAGGDIATSTPQTIEVTGVLDGKDIRISSGRGEDFLNAVT
jgi:hypothetical protein